VVSYKHTDVGKSSRVGLHKQTLGDSVEVLHFDEAWYAYAAFHEFYDGRYGMGTSRSEEGRLAISIDSTHE
ncbi:hypothetical protein, partial [Klebsiella pneumoniae]|uniref:hypothetical protein n=1 Tax=Klebsiella pneumoniae TaxID=573 RepID=UPI0039698E5D